MGRRNQGWFDLIAATPWPVGIIVGVLTFVFIRYGIGQVSVLFANPYLSAFGKAWSNSNFSSVAWLFLGVFWAAAAFSFIKGHHRSRLLDKQTDMDSLQRMDWREFEMLVGEAFRRRGYQIDETGLGGADGGIDLRLRKDGKLILVQCKHWRNQRVDVKVVREMYGVLAHHHADEIKIVALGDFTPEAREFARGKPIELVQGQALLALVQQVQPQRKDPQVAVASLPPVANAAPLCPSCSAQMVRRTNRQTREPFWGCSRFPKCRGVRAI